MGLSVDSSVLIDVLEGRPDTLASLEALESDGAIPILSTVVLFEVLSGVELSRSRAERSRVEEVLSGIPVEDFTMLAARRSAELRADLHRMGRIPGTADVMIAGHALAEGHTLVTKDRNLAAAARSAGARVELI